MKENIKEKLKSYEFWVSVASAVMVLLQTISIKIDIPYINEVTMAFLSLLTVSGILKKTPNKSKTDAVSQEKLPTEGIEPNTEEAQKPADPKKSDEKALPENVEETDDGSEETGE